MAAFHIGTRPAHPTLARWIVSSYEPRTAHLLPFPSCYRTRCGEPFGITRPSTERDNVCWACTALAEGDAVVRGEK